VDSEEKYPLRKVGPKRDLPEPKPEVSNPPTLPAADKQPHHEPGYGHGV